MDRKEKEFAQNLSDLQQENDKKARATDKKHTDEMNNMVAEMGKKEREQNKAREELRKQKDAELTNLANEMEKQR
jgi:hypothetical protein